MGLEPINMEIKDECVTHFTDVKLCVDMRDTFDNNTTTKLKNKWLEYEPRTLVL